MTDAEKVVKALRARCTCPRVAGMECGDCAKWDALADFVEADMPLASYMEQLSVLDGSDTTHGKALREWVRRHKAAIARLAEVMR